MTKTITFLFILFITFVSAQEVNHTGTYYWESLGDDSKLSRKLTINTDGTFTFDWYRKLPGSINKEEFAWGKGTWRAKGKLIYFTTDTETEIDEKYTLDFTNTKGRWDARNNRLILFESDIFWLKRFAIQKQ